MKCTLSAVLLAVLATAGVVAGRPLPAATGAGRRLTDFTVATTTYSIEWDMAYGE